MYPKNDNEEEVITSPDDLEDDDLEEEEGAEDSANPEEKENPDEPSEGDEPSDEEEDPEGDQDTVTVDSVDYTRGELEEIFAEGKKVSEYKKSHPGFDPLLIHRDYTKKTQELANLKKGGDKKTEPKEEIDLSGVDPKDVEVIERIIKAKGYVKKDDLEKLDQERFKQTYESVKNQKINEFLQKYPMYHPANDKNDTNWGALLEEFSLYKLPSDPEKISELLERAHVQVNPGKKPLDPKTAAKVLAQKKVNSVGKNRSGGSSGGATKGKVLPAAAQHLKGFSNDELQDIFS